MLRVEAVGNGPRALTILGGGRFTVTVPPGKGPFFVALDTTPTACVSLVLDEAATLAEVAIYTEADGSDGLARLAAELAEGGPASEAAERALAQGGAAAARALDDVLQKGGRHRLRLLRALASVGVPEAAGPLGRALETAAGDARAVVVEGLAKLGAAGTAEATRLYQDRLQAPAARADAAQVLGRTGAVAPLVAGVGRGEPEVRAATAQALIAAGAVEPLVAVLQEEPRCGSGVDAARLGDLAGLVGQLARGSSAAPAASERLVEAARCAVDFALRVRLHRALGAVGDPQAAPFLDERARGERDEVLRYLAVQAAGALEGGAGRATLRHALGDADPRVRKTAILGLAARKEGGPELARALGTDGWPLVRRAAAEGLGLSCGAPGPLIRALGDSAEEVRLATLASLARCGNLSHPLLAGLLLDDRQPPAVRGLATALLARSDYPEAPRTLARALGQVLDHPTDDERGAHLALSILRALSRRCDHSREAREALTRAAEDPEPQIQRAARQTLDRCR
jgi:HEAT repeat protein